MEPLPLTRLPLRDSFSWSQAQSFRICPFAYVLRYVYRLKSKKKTLPLARGWLVDVGVTAALRQHARLGKWTKAQVTKVIRKEAKGALDRGEALQGEDDPDWEEFAEDCVTIAHRGLGDLDLERFETVVHRGKPMIQYKIEMPFKLGHFRRFVGVLDWVAKERDTGRIWLVDLKVRKTYQESVSHMVGAQWAIYQHIMKEQLGMEIDGSVEWWVRGEVPHEPKVNKNGSISRAACATDWPTYLKAIKREKQDPAEYEETRVQLEAAMWSNFMPYYRTAEQCRDVWENTICATAAEIHDVVDHRLHTPARNLGFMCRSCDARPLCHGQLAGDDTSWLIEEGYDAPQTEEK